MLPRFRGNFAPNLNYASISLSIDELSYNIAKLQYKWLLESNSNQVVSWCVVFTPDDGSAPRCDGTSWNSAGATESPVFVIDPANSPTLNPDHKNGTYQVMPVDLAVDANRDGVIKFAGNASDSSVADKPMDTTTESKPYRFWVNDDDDHGDASGSDGTEHVPIVRADYTSSVIGSKRDLEDFARLWVYIGGMQDAITSGSIQIGLKWKTVSSGSPAIKIFSSADANGSGSYLTDDNAATAQVTGTYGYEIKDKNSKEQVDANGTFILPKSVWNGLSSGSFTQHFLFEGASEGKGQLELVFLDGSGNQIGEGGSLWLDIKNIKKMYERGFARAANTTLPYTTTNSFQGPNVALGSDPNSSQQFNKPFDETSQCIVFVHGFNMTYDASTNLAETMFKRLWWRGFKGRFGSFRWPTFGSGGVMGAIGTYNDSEYMAWNSGAALKQFVANMPRGYSLNVVAHSMGNLVTGEALREGMTAGHYAMLHAATSASCYSNGDFSFQVTNTGVNTPDTDSEANVNGLAYSAKNGNGFTGWLGSIGGQPINFGDCYDTVVGWKWDYNNNHFKPQGFQNGNYRYNVDQIKLSLIVFTTLRAVTDQAETKAYINYSLTGAIGCNETQGGAVADYQNDNSFGDEHSSEWDRNIQDSALQSFYNTLMTKFEMAPNP
jgi:pimeloyl-ACP methyl ester carboxylesterase